MKSIPEADWQYLRRIKDELLDILCQRINEEAASIVRDRSSSPHDNFLRLYRHVQEANERVADCFDDWRRSTLWIKLHYLRKEELLTDEELSRLTEETQSWLK